MSKKQLLTVLRAKYESDIEQSKVNINTFLSQNIGVADHINFTETLDTEIEKLARAKDMLDALKLIESDIQESPPK
jgi:dimeric dUTPase (all-alpha-NTP-PPase superfamily)